MKHSLIFVATTPFAVNAFLRTHLIALAKTHEITLCVNTSAYPLVEDVAHAVHVRHVNITRKIAFGQDLLALFQLFRCFREIRPTVVHSLTPKAGLLAMLAAWLVGVPCRFHTFTGQVWANKTGVSRFLMRSIDKIITTCATRVFADSASQCRFLEEEGVVQRGGVSVLGRGSVAGVDLSRFRPDAVAREILRTELGIADNIPVFLFVGRLVRDKGVFDLVEAFALVNIHHPEWELWMVGPDEDGIKVGLQARAEHLGVRILWFGPTFSPERYMATADVFVLPSYREGFGSVIIEAAACGIPSVAYRIDGVVDAVIDGSTGLLVEAGNVCSLADSMKQLGCEQAIRKKLGKTANLRAVNDFSSFAVSGVWQEFYATILKGKPL